MKSKWCFVRIDNENRLYRRLDIQDGNRMRYEVEYYKENGVAVTFENVCEAEKKAAELNKEDLK